MVESKTARVVILFDANGLKVQSNGVASPTVIFMLEGAKTLMLRQTLGPEKTFGDGKLVQAPALQGRKVDREVA